MRATIYRPRLISFCLAGLFTLLALSGFALDYPTDPLLRIEAGAHTALVRRLSVDASGRYAVTCSDDKSVRVWELYSGGAQMIRIIRPAIAGGNEGKLYSVAISPDGNLIAAAGWTDDDRVFFFDRASGALKASVVKVGNVTMHMTFSPDGKYLAAVQGGSTGLKVIRISDFSVSGEDSAYGLDSYAACFAPGLSGYRLVTSSWDKKLRLYDINSAGKPNKIKEITVVNGQKPYGLSINKNGILAVGYDDKPLVDFFSASDLSFKYSGPGDLSGGSLSSVSWSEDGRTLYAGGKYNIDSVRQVVAWGSEGRDQPRKIASGAVDTIMTMAFVPGKSCIMVGSADPVLSFVDSYDVGKVVVNRSICDYRDCLSSFKISPDASIVQFSYIKENADLACFDAGSGQLSTTSPGSVSLTPITTAPGISLSDYINSYDAKLNGTSLGLKQFETSRCLAISPDYQSFFLGTDWYVHKYDKNGKELWNTVTPGAIWDINLSANGKIAVAAFADGSIRWYLGDTGKELLVFFPHRDHTRWVAWTPSGYYDVSPGGEELIGWHLNQGIDSASDFFSASRFRSTYYRPDVVRRVLSTMDETNALKLADNERGSRTNQMAISSVLPPIISILSPSEGSSIGGSTITIRYAVRSPSGEPITGVRVFIDGRPAVQSRGVGLKPKGKDEVNNNEITIEAPEGDCELSLIADNRFTSSEPAKVRLVSPTKTAKVDASFVIKPKLYVLSIGISKYLDPNLALGLASKDAQDFAKFLKTQEGGLYREVVAKTLTDDKATKDDILDGLDWIQKETTARDVAMVFIAGHGVNDQSGDYYFLPQNANLDKLMRTGVSFSDIKKTVSTVAGKSILFVDTCHSGNVMGGRRGATADLTGIVNELSSAENGVIVFASSTGKQYSLEKSEWGNGAFTKALIEGLSGKADYLGKGKISINMLDLYISERVKELTKGQQTPSAIRPETVPDFPIAVIK